MTTERQRAQRRLTDDQVIDLRTAFFTGRATMVDLTIKYKVGLTTVKKIIDHKRYKDVPLVRPSEVRKPGDGDVTA